jgi:hypothetical protein
MRDRPNDEHRRALEAKLGRKLLPSEIADHVNEDKGDNSPANLRPMDRGEHTAHHNRRRTTGQLVKALSMFRRGEKSY